MNTGGDAFCEHSVRTDDAAVHLHTQFEPAAANQHLFPTIPQQRDWFLRVALSNK